ncbi:MAG TPA: strictosidine synthase, partial [Roseiarcus sp.]|nr:strictosidine synthase [Roseiarcus sp.]
NGEPRVLAAGLRCPMGVARDARGELIVTEFESARIVDLSGAVRQAGYPGYLGRLRQTATGYVMTCLSRRDPLIEFLKSERKFVEAMKATIPPRHWIAPRVNPEFSHDFPIELGATRLFGEIKPWAPSFSYGLVIELDDALMPIGAAHSRADGRRHGISDALVWNGDLIAVSKASGELLNLGCARGPA